MGVIRDAAAANERGEGVTFPVTRTPEQGHEARCLAKAMIAAIENLRDGLIEYPASDYYFRLAVQRNDPMHMADEYLATGTTECVCEER